MMAKPASAIGPEHAAPLEAALLGLVPEHAASSPVFIVGSPRTGSTLLFQLLVLRLGLPFVSNLTNDLLVGTLQNDFGLSGALGLDTCRHVMNDIM